MKRTVALLAFVLLAFTAVAPAGAASSGTPSDAEAIEVRDLTVTVSDTHITGGGLPDWSVERASYTIDDATVATDGFTVVYDGEAHDIGAVQVTVDDVGLVLEDVSVGDEA